MTTRRQHDFEGSAPAQAISASGDEWVREFVKRLELYLIDAAREIAGHADIHASRLAAARAILATFLGAGMELDGVMELLGQAALGRTTAQVEWSDGLNQRRFELIDKEIQGSLTPAESVELAGLTGKMREHIDSERNLPMEGARALHRKLLQLGSTGGSK